ncbi:MAG: tetratricopeptide repeat protein [Deltaproteobacteria bacterium]
MSSIRQLRKRIKERPDDPHAWYELAVALANGGKIEETHDALRQALGCHPPASLALSIGMSLLGLQDEVGAAGAFQLACTLDPDSVQGRLRMGGLLLKWDRPEEAVRWLREAVIVSDHAAEPCFQYAVACERCGQVAEATSYFYLAINKEPGKTDAYRHLASLLVKQNLHAGANRAWRRVNELDPGDLRAKTALGVGLSNRGQHRRAVELLTEVARTRPDSADAFADLGMALSRASSHDQALQALRQAISLNPQSAQVRLNYGVALLLAGRAQEAMASFWEVVSMAPDWSLAHYNVGLALRELGDLTQARNSLLKASQLDPSDSEIEAALRDTMLQLARPQGLEAPDLESSVNTPRGGSISGEIQTFPIVEVLEFLKINHSTGVLDIKAPSFAGNLRVENGDLIGGKSPSTDDILTLLVKLEAITREDLSMMIADEGEDALSLGFSLVEDGVVTPALLQKAMRMQIRVALLEVLSCKEGAFAFNEVPPITNGDVEVRPVDTRHALMEVITHLDEQSKQPARKKE